MGYRVSILVFLLFIVVVPVISAQTLTDSLGRKAVLPENIEHIICSGPGCLRLLTYMQAEDLVIAVDDLEGKRRRFDSRPYAIANPQFKRMPIFGEFRGHDNPELILSLDPQPQVIFKTYATMGYDPVELQKKTGIPVVVLNYGNLSGKKDQFYQSLRIIGRALRSEERAEAVIRFFQSNIEDLEQRTENIAEENRPAVYLGGVAFKGPHGFQSTEPTYPPFTFVNVNNLASDCSAAVKDLQISNIAKEKIVAWNPDILFLDLATLQMGENAGGLYELRSDAAYQTLTAVQLEKVYGVLPYNWYTTNYGSILANAYYIGHLLYPENFQDVEPVQKADSIYTFLVGKPVFQTMNNLFANMVFKRIFLE